MSSATGIPQRTPAAGDAREDEPLLGRPGDASQPEEKGLQNNLVIGTAVLAQAGIWILAALVWSGVFMHDLSLFVVHPLLNSAGLVFLTQAILILQPTHTQDQKIVGTHWHFTFNLIGILILIAGLIIIEYNKGLDPSHHWKSVHAYLGVLTYILIVVQALVGFAQFYLPNAIFGSVDTAKSVYKYHRASGYIILLLALATVCAATYTPANSGLLQIQPWAVIVASVLVVLGVAPRIKKYKFGF
ncbi:MAG: hypothetical protein Q9227_001812 [Pyrenula ochraceoflavens]